VNVLAEFVGFVTYTVTVSHVSNMPLEYVVVGCGSTRRESAVGLSASHTRTATTGTARRVARLVSGEFIMSSLLSRLLYQCHVRGDPTRANI
jgi:hypothetical protein